MPLQLGTVSTRSYEDVEILQFTVAMPLQLGTVSTLGFYHCGNTPTIAVAMPLQLGTVSTAPLSPLSINVFIFQKARFLTDYS